jgi:hypothetical protein|tara:strand:- start:689 stop:1555 length:867 start_codon:yes stop_codon:yes gene_type:complete
MMSEQKRIKHSKVKNTGLLFEFLLRQITADILDKKNKSIAISIIKSRFNERTELGKELLLYNILINKKFNTDKKADFFISEVLTHRKKINQATLRREKYNLIKELKDKFNLANLLSSKVKNYKIYASIYKLFEFSNSISPEEKTETHFNLMEHITTKNSDDILDKLSMKLPINEDVRILSYRILLEKFNHKYSKLNLKQKSLLKSYITNISNTNLLKEYVEKEIKFIKRELKSNIKKIDDKITKIKLNEAINSIGKICNIGDSKTVKDGAIVQLMRYYELIKELKKHG